MKTLRERGFNDELDLDTILTVFFNKINQLISIYIVSIIFLSFIYIFQERVYQSSALLQFEGTKTLLPSLNNLSSQQSTFLNAEKEIFKSLDTIDGLKKRLTFDSEDLKLPNSSIISSGLSFTDDRKNLLTINYSNNDEKLTQLILSNLIDEFLSNKIQNNRISALKGIEFVDKEIPNLKEQLNKAELDLIKFKSSDGNNFIFDTEFRGNSIESLNKEIKAIELKEIELREFYKSTHPIYTTLIQQKNILIDELEELETGVQDLPSEQRKLFNLNQKVDIYSSSLEELEKQKLSLSLVAASSTSNVRIINSPSEAIKISPNLSLLLLSFVVLLVTYFVFLLNHFFSDKIMSLDALLDFLEDRDLFLGAFPFINIKNKNKRILLDIEKNFTDRIIINILNSEEKVYLVSSMKEGVGKSYLSEKLTKNLSNFSSKICLLDLDLRKKGLSESSDNFKKKGINVSDFLDNKNQQGDIVYINKPIISDPLAYLNSDSLANLIKKLRDEFDKVVIDSPPMGTFIDAKLISKLTDKTICVLSSHESSFSELSLISKELKRNDSDDLKLVFFLNKVKYFLEIFWFSVRYPIYGGYTYYNPYNYYSADKLKTFRKLEKYVSFTQKKLKDWYKKVMDFVKSINFRKK